jgi:hypothetical protein
MMRVCVFAPLVEAGIVTDLRAPEAKNLLQSSAPCDTDVMTPMSQSESLTSVLGGFDGHDL